MFELIKDPDTGRIKVNSTKGKKILNTYAQSAVEKEEEEEEKLKKLARSKKEDRTTRLCGKQGCKRVNVKKKKQDDKRELCNKKL